MSKHAILSPSGGHRWMQCGASARLEAGMPDSTNEAADEGTVLHTLAHMAATQRLRPDEFIGETLEGELGPYVITAEQAAAVGNAMAYVGYWINDDWDTAYLEQRVKLPFLPEPEASGTADVVCIQGRTLDVFDYKFGRRHVEVRENPQLRMYGYGLAMAMTDIEKVRLHIVQPRVDNMEVERLTFKELHEYVIDTILPAAERAWGPEPAYAAGDWCTWCKARATCQAFQEYALEPTGLIVADDPTEVGHLTPDQLGEILKKADALRAFVDAVKDYAHEQALSGVKIPGWKLVQVRPTRSWVDEDRLKGLMTRVYGSDAILYEAKMRSPAQLEAHIDKAILAPLVKRTSGTALAPMDDRRPEFDPVQADFADIT